MSSTSVDTKPERLHPPDLPRGASLGRYLVLELIGQGGMGAVYAAYDPELNRRIAIKVMTIVDPDGRRRLLREAQAMARISHANVISVYDVGPFADGVFVAMEHIDGGTLRAWQKGRSWREVLPAYVQAGRGLLAAHRAALVHRDFKPDNVLVGKDGRASVTDFGLVRSGDPDSYDTPLAETAPRDPSSVDTPIGRVTRGGAVLGTPEYMSPEQHLGRRSDERSDQFSFCVSLYEGAYGQHPFGDGTELFDALLAGRVRPPPAGSGVPGWIRRVLLRGLARDPAARYPDMGALLEDLGRDRGVRRAWFAAAALAALAAVGVTWTLAEGRTSRQVCPDGDGLLAGAWDGAARRRVSDGFSRAGAPHAAEMSDAVSRALDGYTAAWAAMHGDACRQSRVLGVQSAELLDRRMLCLEGRLAAVRRLVSLFETADRELVARAPQAAYALPGLDDCAAPEALEARRDPAVQQKLSQVAALRAAGKYREALALAGDVAPAASGPLLAQALIERGRLETVLGDGSAATRTLAGAAAVAVAAGDEWSAIDAWEATAGAAAFGLGRFDEAERWARLAEAAAVRTAAGTEREADVRRRLATLLAEVGRNDEAVVELNKALAIQERKKGADHPAVAELQRQLGKVALAQGRYADARAAFASADKVIRRAYGEHHVSFAALLQDQAAVAWAEGGFRDSLDLNTRALTILRETLGDDNPEVGLAWRSVAMSHEALGDLATALADYRQALAICEKEGADHIDVASVLGDMGSVLHRMGEYQAALDANRRALPIQEKAYGPESPQVGQRLANLGLELKSLGRYVDAKDHYQRALVVLEKVFGRNHPNVGILLDNQGEVLRLLGDARAALATYERSVAILEQALGKDHPIVADALTGMGRSYVDLGEEKLALPPLERALALRQNDGDTDHNLAETRFALAQALVRTRGDRGRARALLEKSRAAYAHWGDARKKEREAVDALLRRL